MRFILSRSIFWSTLTFYTILTEKGFCEYEVIKLVSNNILIFFCEVKWSKLLFLKN